MRSIVCIGDSIRMGYMPAVEKVLEGWGKVLGIGDVQGGNTRNVLAHLDQWAIRPAPDIVYLNAGLHDMARDPGPGPENRVPLSEYSLNLRRIFARLRRETEARLLFALTTPVDLARQHAVDYAINRTDDDVILYNEAAARVTAELGIPTLDLYQVAADQGTDRMLGEDGVHFTAAGSAVLGRAVADFIRTGGR